MRTGLLFATLTFALTACEAQIEAADRAPTPPGPKPVTPAAEPPPPGNPEPAPIEPPAPAPVEPPVPPPPTTPPPPPATTGSIAVALPSTQLLLRLNETKSVTLTVTPSNGFDGTVTFAVTGLPAGVTAFFAPSDQVAVSGTAPVQVTLSLRSKSDLMGALGMPLTVTATSGSITSSAPLTLDLLQEVLITIPKNVPLGTAQAPNNSAFGAVSTQVLFVNPGTKVTFINMDTRNHEIHANNNPTGLQHQPGQLQANGANSYSQILKAGTVNFRCHIHPNMLGQIVVK